MAQKYPIYKIVSHGKKGAQITVKLGNKSVTRHIDRSFRGKHPDDSIPTLHARLETNLSTWKAEANRLQEQMQKVEDDKRLTPEEKELAFQGMQYRVVEVQNALAHVEKQLHTVRVEDPLIVQYYEGGDNV